jgi:hypothetical protein
VEFRSQDQRSYVLNKQEWRDKDIVANQGGQVCLRDDRSRRTAACRDFIDR